MDTKYSFEGVSFDRVKKNFGGYGTILGRLLNHHFYFYARSEICKRYGARDAHGGASVRCDSGKSMGSAYEERASRRMVGAETLEGDDRLTRFSRRWPLVLLYARAGRGEKHYCAVEYKRVDSGKSFSGDDYFCDESGKKDENMPAMQWKTEFLPEGTGTKLVSTVVFPSAADLEKILSMGMQEGYTMGLNQLEKLLAKG